MLCTTMLNLRSGNLRIHDCLTTSFWVNMVRPDADQKSERSGIFKGLLQCRSWGEHRKLVRGTEWKCLSLSQGRERKTVGKHFYCGFCGKKRLKKGKQTQNLFPMFESSPLTIFTCTVTVTAYGLKRRTPLSHLP